MSDVAEPGRYAPEKIRLARLIALSVDFVQILLFPLFFGGLTSLANDALDVLTALALTWLLGWRWAFVPTLIAEMVPVLDLFPTWTAAVFYVTWGREASASAPPP